MKPRTHYVDMPGRRKGEARWRNDIGPGVSISEWVQNMLRDFVKDANGRQ